MNNNNSMVRGNLSREEIDEIKKAAMFKKLIKRVEYGIKSLLKNPLKTYLATMYIFGSIKLWLEGEEIIKHFFTKGNDILLTVFQWSVPTVASITFVGMMALFGTKLHWAHMAEEAFISAGIYTKAGKAPWLLDRYKDKEAPIFKIWEIYLNGNKISEFEEAKENLESELGINIKNFKKKGTQIVLMFSAPDKVRSNKNNRADMNY